MAQESCARTIAVRMACSDLILFKRDLDVTLRAQAQTATLATEFIVVLRSASYFEGNAQFDENENCTG